jgi:Na+-transporting NADH:ubiquinone oxidoreductase subunit D
MMMLRKFLGAEGYRAVKNGIWNDQPIFSMVLGICSALAITNRVENAIAMGAGVTFVLIATALVISPLRTLVPLRARIITYMVTIASFVIIVDRFLKAFYPDISVAIGPYVGLIITNCIIMGRAEAFYIQNKTSNSVLDALSNGIGYSYTLISVAIVRELLGFGTLLGIRVMPSGWNNWVVMTLAPGAFFLLGIFLWITRTVADIEPRTRE